VNRRRTLAVVLMIAGSAVMFFAILRATTPPPSVAKFSEPLVPTAAPRAIAVPRATAIAQTARYQDTLWRGKARWGIGVAIGPATRYDLAAFAFGWHLDWSAHRAPAQLANAEFAQMVRVRDNALTPAREMIVAIARAHPGSLWLIGNEPDVKWQDNVEPASYARLYNAAYVAIKSADPTARIAIGGITQPSPLRLRYLDRVLADYQTQFGAAMPIDVWNIHNFILREERNSWGVEIPPGFSDAQGILYEVEDSANLDAFRAQIIAFRKWMAERGFQNRELIVSEYGIPMPEDYGFPPARVLDFLTGTFDFFFTATDPALGYPADDFKLVQRWCWYSLDDTMYPTGRLFDPQTGNISEFGIGLQNFIARWVNK
jgi:hypothetical protein